jgi:hypothetical protein
MSCPAISLQGVTAEKYATLLATAHGQGLNLTGVTGTTQFQGMDFTWNYDEGSATLTIQCTNKPIFIPCSMIESRIRSLMA